MEFTIPWEVKHEIIVRVEETTDPSYGCLPENRAIMDHLKNGMINLDKPPGPTSHEVVAWIKRILGLQHAGHGGTLEAYAGEIH